MRPLSPTIRPCEPCLLLPSSAARTPTDVVSLLHHLVEGRLLLLQKVHDLAVLVRLTFLALRILCIARARPRNALSCLNSRTAALRSLFTLRLSDFSSARRRPAMSFFLRPGWKSSSNCGANCLMERTCRF